MARYVRLWLRFLHIFVTWVLALVAYGWRRLWAGRLSAEQVERLRGDVLSHLLQKLGATFIKFGQILSTRPDLLGPGFIEPLARLQDAVPPAPFPTVRRVLDEELGEKEDALIAEIDETPVAAASVAQVHRARLRSGEAVALKVQRPDAVNQIERDLSILGFWARLLDRFEAVRMLPLPGIGLACRHGVCEHRFHSGCAAMCRGFWQSDFHPILS